MWGWTSGRNSRTVIGNLDRDAIVIAISSNPQLPFSAHRVNRIVDDVGPHLVEFAAK